MPAPTIVWLRRDLRLSDNPALAAAASRGGAVIVVYIHAPHEQGKWPPGAATRWWLHQNLAALDRSLRRRRSRLSICEGDTLPTLRRLIKETDADAVYWNRLYDPASIARDKVIKQSLRDAGIDAQSFNAALLFEPWEIKTGSGGPYQVFTPFWRTCQSMPAPPAPVEVPTIRSPDAWPESLELDVLGLEPTIDWAGGMRATWHAGEDAAAAHLDSFAKSALADYREGRDQPSIEGTSRLSPYLALGVIGPRQIWHRLRGLTRGDDEKQGAVAAYIRELGWREFAHHLLYHFPHTTDQPLRDAFAAFPWRTDAIRLRAWQRGQTGYPIVDAGMRELWRTGWMHNRVRMITASFLVKDLLLPWHDGARWFWDTLVDADLANNTLGWQWSAGCGADAAPYFRVFNPTLQGRKFDADGAYVRRWVPELAALPDRWLHEPWNAPQSVLDKANVRLCDTYPRPIVDHAEARKDALDAYDRIKGR